MSKLTKNESVSFAQLAEQLTRNNKGTIVLSRGVSFRMPVDKIAWLDVMANKTSQSRTSVLNDIIEAGIKETMKSLDENTSQALKTLQIERMDEIVRQYQEGNLGGLFEKES